LNNPAEKTAAKTVKLKQACQKTGLQQPPDGQSINLISSFFGTNIFAISVFSF